MEKINGYSRSNPQVPRVALPGEKGAKKAGYNFFRSQGHFRTTAVVKALFNYTVAPLFSTVAKALFNYKVAPRFSTTCYVIDIIDRTPTINEFSYQSDKHKGAVFVLGNSGKSKLIDALRQQSGDTSLSPENGAILDSSGERPVRIYEIPRLSQAKTEKSPLKDLDKKIKNAGACIFTYPIQPGSKFQEHKRALRSLIQHLPLTDSGKPDISKVKFAMVYGDDAYQHAFQNPKKEDVQKIFSQYVNSYITAANEYLQQQFGITTENEQWDLIAYPEHNVPNARSLNDVKKDLVSSVLKAQEDQ